MGKRNDISRREFLKSSAVAGASAAVLGGLAPARVQGANDRIRLGFLGTGGRQSASGFPGTFWLTPFHRPQLPCSGDPRRKTTVWRKGASQLLLISEHDVRVHPRCAPCRQPTGSHRHCCNRRDHKGDRHGIRRLHAKQQGRNQPI